MPENTAVALSPQISKRRLSRMSESAPAAIARRNSGALFATCTRATRNASFVRLVISQPAAALYIQPPMFETIVAIQRIANIRYRKASSGDAPVGRFSTATTPALLGGTRGDL